MFKDSAFIINASLYSSNAIIKSIENFWNNSLECAFNPLFYALPWYNRIYLVTYRDFFP